MALKYRRYVVGEIKPGMVLGTDALSADGKVMLSAGTVFTEATIRLLAAWGFDSAIILEDEAVGDEVREKRLSERMLFNAKYEETVSMVRDAFDQIRYFEEVPLKKMQHLSENALLTLTATPGALGYLHSLRDVDNYTFQHSVNVAIISGVLSRWLGDDGERMRDMVLAGLLHDVGKAMVPLEILNKPGQLTPAEMEVMQKHSAYGYEMLKKAKVLAGDVLAGVWQHHERLDGSGYPRGLRGGNILPSARIIAISDIYDAMTSDRIYRLKMTPFHVIKTLFENMFDKLDASMCTIFLNNLKDYFVGTTVELSDGRLAEVIFMDWISWDRLTVRTSDGECIQLGEHAEQKIVRCLQA
ncbi:HD-GYP domain-containing protein [Anaeroselena agilis]|uniref:HD-GYP domain-containing protein n=1 Tax=Anaeroselena agilis TaxID=3063788 RepID=A0ABU3P203_9FIRM|nr:HD-GYP domain-containing protein [Selenomonadales bacterium 4137-cl]